MNRTASLLVALVVLAACGEPTRPGATGVSFVWSTLDLDTLPSGTISLRNPGTEPAHNIGIELGALKTAAGDSVLPTVPPEFVATLEPGESVPVQVTVAWPVAQPPGTYEGRLSNGLISVIDVSGRLLGELDRQGRLIARVQPGGYGNTFVWAPQLVEPDLVFLSDMISGLWAVAVTGPGP